MDWTSWICFLVTLMHIPGYIADNEVGFDIWEGNVTVLWDPPKGAPVQAFYQVKQAPYSNNEWDIVPECNMTTETKCELGNFLFKPEMKIKIELQGDGNFSWSAVRRIRLYRSKLLSPEFDLSSTANMVKVKIHRKPFLKDLFDYGPSYSAILYPKGQESQAITVSDDDDEDGEVEFTSLPLWQEYCVRVKVEITSNDVSNTSLPRCIYPSADMSLVISMAVIGVVGVGVILFIFAVCFFLRRPGKMPAVLKSAVNGWHPMNVGLIQVETVTDKGWLLTSNKMVGKSKAFDEDKDLSEEDGRRESTDSGVSVGQQHSLKNRGTGEHTGEEDSGCGSLTGTEDSLSSGRRSLEELPFLNRGVNNSNGERKDDSGLGMGNQDEPEMVVFGDGYRSQSPSAEAESEATVPCNVHTKMASPSCGYQSGHVTCLCSDFETCIWCKTRKHLTDSDSLAHEKPSTFTSDNDNDRPSYLKKSPLQTVNMLGLGDLSSRSDENCSESSLFITCPLLLQEPCQLDTLCLTLGDVELTFT